MKRLWFPDRTLSIFNEHVVTPSERSFPDFSVNFSRVQKLKQAIVLNYFRNLLGNYLKKSINQTRPNTFFSQQSTKTLNQPNQIKTVDSLKAHSSVHRFCMSLLAFEFILETPGPSFRCTVYGGGGPLKLRGLFWNFALTGILLRGSGAIESSSSSESLSVSLRNIGPFFKNRPGWGTKQNKTDINYDIASWSFYIKNK